MTAADCTDALPFFDSSDNTCKVAGGPDDCPDARPVFMTGGSCAIAQDATECPDARPVFMTGGSCAIAQDATDCPDARPVFMTGGSCAIAQDATDCPDARPVFMTGGSCAIAQDATECPDARPVFMTGGSCVIATIESQCPADRPFFVSESGACRLRVAGDCPDARPVFVDGTSPCVIATIESQCPADRPFFVSESGACRLRVAGDCPDASPVFVDGTSPCVIATIESQCPADRPFFVSESGACRLRVAGDCTDPTLPVFVDGTSPCREIRTSADCASVSPTMPVFVSGGTCRMAANDGDCETAHPTMPIRMSTGACRPADLALGDCIGMQTVENGACTNPPCTGQVVQDGVCVATCHDSRTLIGNVCTSPALTRAETIPPVDTHNYGALRHVGGDGTTAHEGNSAIFSSDLGQVRTTVTQGTSPRDGGSTQSTANEVQLTPTGSAFTGLTIKHFNPDTNMATGTGVTWEVDDDDERTATNTTTDRRALSGGIGWNYDTIAVNAADLLNNEASNDDEVTNNTGESIRNFRAAVVEWSTDANSYMAGGVWGYDETDGTRTATSEVVGAFVDGDFTPIANAFPTPALGDPDVTAMYAGHSFGVYATLPAAEGEGNRGFFAAEAEIRVTFSGLTTRVSGTIDEFRFSSRGTDAAAKLGFTAAAQSSLEKALMVDVDLGTAEFSQATSGAFPTITGTAMLNLDGTVTPVNLGGRGAWAFFGPGNTTLGPPGFGGTWAASGQTGTTNAQTGVFTPTAPEADGGFGISFIGSFGAKLVPTTPPP